MTLGQVAAAWKRWERARDALLAIRHETAQLRPEQQPTSRPEALEARAAHAEYEAAARAFGKEYGLRKFWRTFPGYWEDAGWEILRSSFPEVKPNGPEGSRIAKRKATADARKKRGRPARP